MSRPPARTGWWLLAAFLLMLSGCAGSMGVEHLAPEEVLKELSGNVITTGQPSTAVRNVLVEYDLVEVFADQPDEALARLHKAAVQAAVQGAGGLNELYALAALSFLHAQEKKEDIHYLAAAVYAWAFLFPEGIGGTVGRLDPRLRTAADIYNRSLTLAFASTDRTEVTLRGGTFALPFGALEVAFDPASLRVGERRLVHLAPVADLAVYGFDMRFRYFGIGAPLAAATEPLEGQQSHRDFLAPKLRVPVTALLRLKGARAALVKGAPLTATLEVYPEAVTETVDVAGEQVPLEMEPTAALALSFEGQSILLDEIKMFLGSMLPLKRPPALISTTPYRPGRIPVVFVHGTVSSPARWAPMFNRLQADPAIRGRFQFWAFSYDSANPIAFSALLLRDALTGAVARLDPEGKDPALRRMVLIGHSQGGLLVKMLVVNTGDRLWRARSPRPFEELLIPEETKTLLRRGLFVEPLPLVSRVVFIATPHGGALPAASDIIRNLVRRLITLPLRLGQVAADLTQIREALGIEVESGSVVPSAVDNMSPTHPFIQTLRQLPIAPGVTVNSIIAVEGDGPPEEGNDGVVEYSSAHIEGVESELVVRSSHSTQAVPATIMEVRRILRLHAGKPLRRRRRKAARVA